MLTTPLLVGVYIIVICLAIAIGVVVSKLFYNGCCKLFNITATPRFDSAICDPLTDKVKMFTLMYEEIKRSIKTLDQDNLKEMERRCGDDVIKTFIN
jgi:hypothetical protein